MSSNHVSFAASESGAGPSRQPYVHPSRLISGVHTAPEPKQKTKSDNQKRYEKKKNKKRKKVLKAQKAAAPKHKIQTSWKVDPVLEALKRAAVASNGNNHPDGNEGVAIPNSTSDVERKDVTVPLVESTSSKTKIKKTKKEKKEKEAVAPEAEVDSEVERERRRAEKREKREKRDRKERRQQEREALLKAEAKAEEDAAKAIEFVSRAPDGAMDVDGGDEGIELSESDEDETEDEEDKEEDEKMSEDVVNEEQPEPSRAKSPSPPPLQAFPLPTSAPAPSAAILARQGLPAGLEDATFIDQDLRVGLDDLQVRQVIGREPLSDRIKGVLKLMGVEDFFAVQAAILPHLLPLRQVPLPYDTLHDYLISAPTGSGKTLAYAVPIVEILSKRIITRLRALIVLPTRDLVGQVRETLEVLARGTGLTVGAITGQHSFAQEQTQLVGDLETKLLGGSSKLDILVATPGRLMDHLNSTPNFTLQHLRFLVIDEADRLLNQSFQDWLAQVLAYTRPPTPATDSEKIQIVDDEHSHLSKTVDDDDEVEDDAERPLNDPVAPAWMEALGLRKRDPEWMFRPRNVCQKLLFSATLTRDPSKVAALSLNQPQYFIVQSSNLANEPINLGEQFAFPSTLQEKMLILPPALKPLNLIHLVHEKEYGVDKALVFTKSTESAMRLVKLFEFFEDAYILGGGGGKRVVVKLYTGDIKASERKKVLAEFAEGKINLLICSDLIARGMDLPTVSHVVSYDIPLDMRKYVHRVGRTARAGRQGTAWTLVEKQEALHFKGMMRDADHLKAVKKVKVQEESLAGYRESYDIAIRRLKEHFGRDA